VRCPPHKVSLSFFVPFFLGEHCSARREKQAFCWAVACSAQPVVPQFVVLHHWTSTLTATRAGTIKVPICAAGTPCMQHHWHS
jgi:hypothetical protein